jgi:hypothetical protein
MTRWSRRREAAGKTSQREAVPERPAANWKSERATQNRAIATILSDMDAEIESLETTLTKARRVKQGMVQKLLTGKVRLVQGAPVFIYSQLFDRIRIMTYK